MFTIEFVAPEELSQDGWYRRGEIILGTEREGFRAPLGYWTATDYAVQWRQAAARLLGPPACAGFFTQVVDPTARRGSRARAPRPPAGFAEAAKPAYFWWVGWREGEEVVFQEQLLIPGQTAPRRFTPADPYWAIGSRVSTNEDGERVSEWRVALADVQAFAEEHPAPAAP